MKIAYQAVLTPAEEGGFVVHFPDFDEGFTEGDDESEALFNAAEVLDLTLESRIEDGDPIP